MNVNAIRLLDVVALTEDLPARDVAGVLDPEIEPRDLPRGLVGTVVDELAGSVHLVEFANRDGEMYALVPLRDDQLLLLQYDLAGSSVA